jgi:hypothetical protein
MSLEKEEKFRLSAFKKEAVMMMGAMTSLARTHTTIPLRAVTAALTGISWPFSSFAFVTVNTERSDEVTMKIVASTK